jgi:hypothetical protein
MFSNNTCIKLNINYKLDNSKGLLLTLSYAIIIKYKNTSLPNLNELYFPIPENYYI